MFHILKLLLPALIPSWNFFDVIVPSPRIQFSILNKDGDTAVKWQEFRPRPVYLSVWQMLARILWNPVWNESLFLMSCAERLMEYPTQHSEDEILKRIKADLISDNDNSVLKDTAQVQFRLVFIRREGDGLKEEVKFQSQPQVILDETAP